MRELFTRGLRGEAQKETEIGPVPESWDASDASVTLRTLATWNSHQRRNRHALLRTADIRSSRPRTSSIDMDHHGDTFVRSTPDEYGLIARSPAWHSHRWRCMVKDRLAVKLRCLAVTVDSVNYASLPSSSRRRRMNSDSSGTTSMTLHTSTCVGCGRATAARMSQLELRLSTRTADPSASTLDEQREIVAILDAIDRKIDLHQRKRAVLEELFKALLHKLMTGEIRVADLDLSALGRAPATRRPPHERPSRSAKPAPSSSRW